MELISKFNKVFRFLYRSTKSWLLKSIIDIYSTHNEGKFVVAEKFIRTLKNKIDTYMTSVSKNVYIDKLNDIVNKHNNAYHSTIKMESVDVKSNIYTYILNLVKKLIIKILDSKLVILLEYQI